MNYSVNSSHCRVDIFKPSGKWYQTLVIDTEEYYYDLIHDAVEKALKDSLGKNHEEFHKGWYGVCLEPYHENSHPVMLKF